MTKIRTHVWVSGRVQGVFFRQNTKRQAQIHQVNGWIRNLDDGRVEAVFEGEKTSVEALIDYCRHGPTSAIVEHVEIQNEEYNGEFSDFQAI